MEEKQKLTEKEEAERKKKREELNDSRGIYARRSGNHKEVKAALDFFYEKIKAEYNVKGTENVPKYRHQIRVFILDLFVASQLNPEMYITYSRNKNDYLPTAKYHRMRLSHRIATNIVDYLEDHGYIKVEPGFYDRTTGIGRLPRIRAKEKFRSLLADEYQVKIGMIIWDWDDSQPTVIQRDENKEDIDYDDTEDTFRMKENLKIINQVLERKPILLFISDEEYWVMFNKMKRDANKGVTDLSRKFVRRIFNKGKWDQGGRFYGGFWQNIPRECRRFIRINDADTVECDYSGLHVNMLYAMDDLDMPPGDVYQIPEYPEEKLKDKKVFRDFIKQMLLTLVNSGGEKKREEARQAIHDAVHHKKTLQLPEEIPSTRGKDIFPLMDAFEKKHKDIGHYFCSGKGIDLQYLDSQMAEIVMLHFAKGNYPVLPLHDSFILHHNLEQELKLVMDQAFKEVLETDRKIEVDLKFNSTKIKMYPEECESGPCETPLSKLLEMYSERGPCKAYYKLLSQFREYRRSNPR